MFHRPGGLGDERRPMSFWENHRIRLRRPVCPIHYLHLPQRYLQLVGLAMGSTTDFSYWWRRRLDIGNRLRVGVLSAKIGICSEHAPTFVQV